MFTCLRRDDSGAVAVLVAILAVVLITISALAVDVGYWYTCKRQLQSAADAAALAGAAELGQGGSAGDIQNAVDTYAQRNFNNPLPINARVANTEIGDNYVKVTTETDANVYLARWVLGRGTTLVHAQAVAELGYLAGGRAPVPWGLSILRIGTLTGTMGGQTVSFSEASDGYWETTFPYGASGSLRLDALNDQGYTDIFDGLISIGSIPAGGKIAEMDVNKSTLTSGVDSSVFVTVRLASALATGVATKFKVEADIGTSKISLTPDSTRTEFSGWVPVGTTADPFVTKTLAVTAYEDTALPSPVSCRLLLRRANYLIQDIDAHPIAVAAGQSVDVAVKTLDFTYGAQYQLKVEGGTGTTGNFQALDFATLDHASCGLPVINDPGQSGGADYRANIAGDTGVIAHIGDLVGTKPGDMTGPTKQGVLDRLNGLTPITLEQWEAAGRPETRQLLIIPICERIEDQNGRATLRIVSFGTFFLESRVIGNDTVVGRFIEWTDAGWFVVDNPPDGGLTTMAVHLSTDRLDY